MINDKNDIDNIINIHTSYYNVATSLTHYRLMTPYVVCKMVPILFRTRNVTWIAMIHREKLDVSTFVGAFLLKLHL